MNLFLNLSKFMFCLTDNINILDSIINGAIYSLLHSVYVFTGVVYDIMLSLAGKTRDFDGIIDFGNSVRNLVGIFMLFRILISLLNYLVNPDSFTDKSSGGSKLLIRVIICIALLLLSNLFIFDELKNLQNIIIEDNGTSGSVLYKIFDLDDSNISDIPECDGSNSDACLYSCAFSEGSNFSYSMFYPFIEDENGQDINEIYGLDLKRSFYNPNKCTDTTQKNAANSQKTASTKGIKKNVVPDMNINFIIGVAIGLFSIVMVGIICIDVVVRTLKLFVLEVISPITICCYINPKDKIFNQWLSNYGKTYADLFIKLIGIKLMTILISTVYSKFSAYSNFERLFYIIGIITFAKALPSFISKIFNIENSGSFKESANMLKNGLGFGAGAIGGAAAGAVGGVAAFHATKGQGGLKRAGALFGAVPNALKSSLTGAGAGSKGGIGGVTSGMQKVAKNNQQRITAKASGAGFFGTAKSKVKQNMGIRDDYEKAKATADGTKQALDDAKIFEEETQNKALKDIREINNGKTGIFQANMDHDTSGNFIDKNKKNIKYTDDAGNEQDLTFSVLKNAHDELRITKERLDYAERNGSWIDSSGNAHSIKDCESDFKKAQKVSNEMDAILLRANSYKLDEKNNKNGQYDNYIKEFSEVTYDIKNADDSFRNAGKKSGYSIKSRDDLKVENARARQEVTKHKANHDAAVSSK